MKALQLYLRDVGDLSTGKEPLYAYLREHADAMVQINIEPKPDELYVGRKLVGQIERTPGTGELWGYYTLTFKPISESSQSS
ncbi:MAG: hypothetical protein J4428_03790 [Candidatus Aenigmarchaeota archaeon]|nr:hypothetical protein [Candidatus Aenigmarchaeota archaeon]